MIRLKSASYNIVGIPELGDSIHYNQVKEYTEGQYASSPTLRGEIRRGTLIVLERSGEASAPIQSVPKPEVSVPVVKPVDSAPVVPADVSNSNDRSDSRSNNADSVSSDDANKKYEELLSQIGNLTDTVKELTNKNTELEKAYQEDSKDESPNDEMLNIMSKLVGKVESLSTQVESSKSVSPSADNSALEESLKDISNKISGLNVSGPGIASTGKVDNNRDPGSVYIPDIKVDDLSNNVKLESRSLGQGGSVSAATAALKKLKNNR